MIFVLESEAGLRGLLVYALENAGFRARGFARGDDFLRACARALPRLAVLDITPARGADGVTVLKRLRSRAATRLPLIAISSGGGEYDKVTGLDMGADDYMVKPVGMLELTARVKALLRRAGAPPRGAKPARERSLYRAGTLLLSLPRRTVTVAGTPVALTPKEFDLLAFFLRHKGEAVSRARLLETVWGYEYLPDTRTVDAHVRTLRGKLKEAGGLIRTVRGVGYKLDDGAAESPSTANA